MADKDIMQMAILPAGDSNTWIEAVDANETEPSLQNKRLNFDNLSPDAHVQNTDQFLDEGGVYEVSANGAFLATLSVTPFIYLQNNAGANSSGLCNIAANVSGRVIQFHPQVVGGWDLGEILLSIPSGTYLYIKEKTKFTVVKTTSPFATVSTWVQASTTVVAENDTAQFPDGNFVSLQILR